MFKFIMLIIRRTVNLMPLKFLLFSKDLTMANPLKIFYESMVIVVQLFINGDKDVAAWKQVSLCEVRNVERKMLI